MNEFKEYYRYKKIIKKKILKITYIICWKLGVDL